ncbi:MAG: 30S ribosomal protein S8 [Gammaproteobacteria bacterium]|jgi:small subunit ribosomal protein S8|nr:30S ribosomal protein S8 [Gammaproteobacteria bacterium]MBT5602771.1 30S ribosomal protein S8 [Gammaproteobacteria bacterium]MBT6247046.1 30S ribosomal protein S8 [Gammaproteobacteria bacterium]
MTMQDPIADMLTRMRNGQIAKLPSVAMPSSKTKVEVARVLKEEGYIESYGTVTGEGGQLELSVELKYHLGKPVIEEIKRVSRPGLRQYSGKQEIPNVRNGLGVMILSTNKGVMTDRAARAAGVGGEVLCSVF